MNEIEKIKTSLKDFVKLFGTFELNSVQLKIVDELSKNRTIIMTPRIRTPRDPYERNFNAQIYGRIIRPKWPDYVVQNIIVDEWTPAHEARVFGKFPPVKKMRKNTLRLKHLIRLIL